MQESDMELILLSCLLLLALLLSLFLRTHYYPSPSLPPGNTGYPFLGETLQFFSAARHGVPEKFFTDRMRIHSPLLFKTSLLGHKTAVFCGPEGNKFLFSNENRFVASWWPRNVDKIFPTSLHTSAGEESAKARKLLPGFLKPDSLREYVGVMDSIAREQLDSHWSCRKEVTVLPLAKKYTFAVASRLFLSINDDDSHPRIAKFEEPFNVLVAGILSIPINFPWTPFNRAIKAAGVIRKEVLEIIRQRKRNPRGLKNDILDHMLKAKEENGGLMSELEIADKIIGLMIGGHDTASAAIAFIIKYLAELPEIYQNVLKEIRGIEEGRGGEEASLKWEEVGRMKYTWNVASEALRLAPPLQGSFRIAITDFTYAGFFIPKGWKLYWSTNSTHKNPDYFLEPERFDPGRFEGKGPIPYTYVPFGGGPRMCPGKEYARLEIMVFMYNLVRRFRWEKVIPEEGMAVDPMPMPAHGLPVRLYSN